MSANNEIRIYKKGNKYYAEDRDVDCLGSSPVGTAGTLGDIITIANRYQEANEVEYGLNIDI